MTSTVVLIAILGLAAAQRDASLSVLSGLRQLQPAYRDLQRFVVSAVADAKLNSSEIIYEFHSTILDAKEAHLNLAIVKEVSAHYHINGQNGSIDNVCQSYLLGLVENSMNLAGVGFSNCISTVDAQLNKEISRAYGELAVNETSFFTNISIYDVFKGHNIFVNPDAISRLLQEKLTQLQQLPTALAGQLYLVVENFRTRLVPIQATYRLCLTANDHSLQIGVDYALHHLQDTCLGHLLPIGSTEETTVTTPSYDETSDTSAAL